jgi:hypothetical protein
VRKKTFHAKLGCFRLQQQLFKLFRRLYAIRFIPESILLCMRILYLPLRRMLKAQPYFTCEYVGARS